MNCKDCGKFWEECQCDDASAQSRAEGANLTDVLAAVIGKAFEHEREFLTRFWCGDPNDELLECYMASERTRIAVMVESGATVTDTIPTAEFIEWAEAANAATHNVMLCIGGSEP